jgi:hypothetical protein
MPIPGLISPHRATTSRKRTAGLADLIPCITRWQSDIPQVPFVSDAGISLDTAASAHAGFRALAASEWLVRVKVVRLGIHLIFEDAVRDSSQCVADHEHKPTSNIHPDGIGVFDGRLGNGSAGPSARSSFALSARRRLRRFSREELKGRFAV